MFSRFIFSMLAPAAYVCGRLLVAALRLDTATILCVRALFFFFPLQFLQASIAIRVGDVLIMWHGIDIIIIIIARPYLSNILSDGTTLAIVGEQAGSNVVFLSPSLSLLFFC